MKTIALSILVRCISIDTIGKLIAFCISKLINYASRTGGVAWEKTKTIMKNVERWTKLFNEVYADDKMSEEEEKLVADAIKNMTLTKKVVDILGETEKV